MRFTAILSYNGLFVKVDTLIDIEASLNHVSKEFIMANSFYKACKTTPKLSFEGLESKVSLKLKCFFFGFHQ